MEYTIIIILQLLGIGFHVMQKISALGDKFPEKTVPEIRGIFWKEDWDTLVGSALVLALNLVVHYIIEEYTDLAETVAYYILYAFGAAFILGYAGQRMIYKWLGSAEKKLTEKGDNLINK